MFKNKSNKNKLVMLVTLALLVALEIVLARCLSVRTMDMTFSFGFIAVVTAAILYGPIAAGIVAALSDFLGAVLFPIGAYFPGFTLTACLTGVVFGLFLYKEQSFTRILGATLVNQIFGSLLLNSFWLSVLYGSRTYFGYVAFRTPQFLIMTVVMVIVIGVVGTQLVPRIKTAMAR